MKESSPVIAASAAQNHPSDVDLSPGAPAQEVKQIPIGELYPSLDNPRKMVDVPLVATSPKLLTAPISFPGPCPIVTHHRPDCVWCAALKVIAEAEGRS